MSVHPIRNQALVSIEHQIAFESADREICSAIQKAKDADVPVGLLLALVHGYAHQLTVEMMA